MEAGAAAHPGQGTISQDETRVLLRRAVAHLVDGVIYTILFVIALMVVGALPEGTLATVLLWIVLVGGLTVAHVAYFVLTQRRNGRSPGKLVVGLRVVDHQHRTPGTGALVKRTVPLLIEYFYLIALLGMLSSPYRQRFGDRWGETYVVADR